MKILYAEKALANLCIISAFLTALGLLFGLPVLITAIAVGAVSVGYLVFCGVKKLWEPDYDSIYKSLTPTMAFYAVLIIFVLIDGKAQQAGMLSLPLFFAWLLLSVLLMQALCHDRPDTLGVKYHLVHLGSLAGVGVLGWAMSTKSFWRVIKGILGIIWNYGIRYIMMVIIKVLFWIIQAVVWVVQLFAKEGKALDQEETLQEFAQNTSAQEIFGDVEYTGTPDWLKYTLLALGILLFAFIAYKVIRRLAGNSVPKRGEEEAVKVAAAAPKAKQTWMERNLPTSNRGKVRACWRKFQDICAENNVHAGPNALSAELAQEFLKKWGSAPVSDLRSIWLPARYSSGEVTAQDVKEAKRALKKIKAVVKADSEKEEIKPV